MGERDRLQQELAELAARVENARRILDEIAEDEPPQQHRPKLVLIRGGLSGVAVAAGTWVATKVRNGVREHPVAVSTTTLAGAGLALGVMLAPTVDGRPESDDSHAQRPPLTGPVSTTTDSRISTTTQPGPVLPPSTTQHGPTSIPRSTHIPTGSTSRTTTTGSPTGTTSDTTQTTTSESTEPSIPHSECVIRLDLPGLIDVCLIDLTSRGGTPPGPQQGTAQQLGQRWATG